VTYFEVVNHRSQEIRVDSWCTKWWNSP